MVHPLGEFESPPLAKTLFQSIEGTTFSGNSRTKFFLCVLYATGLTALFGLILNHMLNQSSVLDLAFHALSDPSRRAMVERLVHGPASVSELAKPLEMTLSAVVQHLSVLEASGLVRSKKSGRVRICSIEPKALQAAERWIAQRRHAWERRLDRLDRYLAESRPKE
jgi:DNA-binding transcriptional ArsR family regulator